MTSAAMGAYEKYGNAGVAAETSQGMSSIYGTYAQ
jgi:hypothetical protein